MIAKANILWHNKQSSWFESEELAKSPSIESVLIEATYSFVSLGTERTMLTNNLSAQTAQNMEVPHMRGSLLSDFTYGYSLVGKVVSGVSHLVGKNVHLMHPHQNFLEVDASCVYQIPDSISLELATLASNLETAVNAIWDAELEIGDSVQIVGFGIIGALIAKVINQMPGVSLEINEIDPIRLGIAKNLGFVISEQPKSERFDKVFNTSTGDGVLQEAIKSTKSEGTIIELGWYGERSTTLALGGEFHYGRKKIISSQVSQIPHRKQPKWTYASRKELVFRLLGEIDFSKLITNEIPYSATPAFYNNLRDSNISDLGTIIKY